MSDLWFVYKDLILNNYISLAGCVIVGYDYILTFPNEVDYVWVREQLSKYRDPHILQRRRWTWVSMVFLLVRYPGLCWALLSGLIGSTFIPGPVDVSNALFLVSCWTYPVFICATNLVMILRVYAMWNRSRTILFVLLFLYVLLVIVSVVLPAIYNSSDVYFVASTIQVLDLTVCSGTFNSSVPILLGVYAALPRFLLSAVLFILAVFRTLRQLVDMYNATKRWQPNEYMNQLTRDGAYYFVINTFFFVFAIEPILPIVADLLGSIFCSLLCCVTPRFIICVRELYDHELAGCQQGVDTGFGILTGENGQVSAIQFADIAAESWIGRRNEDEQGGIRLDVVGENMHHV